MNETTFGLYMLLYWISSNNGAIREPCVVIKSLCSLQSEMISQLNYYLILANAIQCYANSYFGMVIRCRCWRNKTVERVQAACKARALQVRSKERREHRSVQLMSACGRGRAPCPYLGLPPLTDRSMLVLIVALWVARRCIILLSCVSLGLPTCSAPGGECSLMLPLCVVISSLPCNGQSLVLQACNNWSACILCLTVYTQ